AIIGAVAFLFWYNWESLSTIRGEPAWTTPQECYAAHVRNAQGSYPVRGDDPEDLRDFCRKVANTKKVCGFDCEVTRVNWEFAITAPDHQRAARLRAYFARGDR